MRLHRFYIAGQLEEKGEVPIPITDRKLLHQWRNVLRMKPGDEVILFDGSGKDFRTEIKSLDRRESVCIIKNIVNNVFSPTPKLHLFVSLIKKDAFDFILEKSTELGAAEIRPIISERSEVKELNIGRAKEIIKEAAEQSGRGNLPVLHEPVKLETIFASNEKTSKYLALEPRGEPFKKEIFANESKLGVFIGPEGGWSENDLKLFNKNTVPEVSLGKQILRSETAAISITAIILCNA